MADKPKDHTKTIEVIKGTIKDLKKQVGNVARGQNKELSAKAKETSPQDHQAALDHFSAQYKMAKMNGQEDKAKEYAKSYHDYAAKLDKHYHAKLNEIGDPEEMYKKTAATSKAKLQAMKSMDKTRQYELERKYSKPEVREEVEQVNELNKKTLASYVSKAAGSYGRDKQLIGRTSPDGTMKSANPDLKRAVKNRLTGINRAAERLANEENLDVASTYKRIAVQHLKDMMVKNASNSSKIYAKKMHQRALEASKMSNHTDALNHYRGMKEEASPKESVGEETEKKYYAIVHKTSKKVHSTYRNLDTAKHVYRQMDKDLRPHLTVIATSNPGDIKENFAEEVEMKEAKKFGYDAINARLKKKTGKSLEDRIKHYEEISARLKKQQDEYEAGNKKQNEALDWGSMSKSEFKRRELEHELRHEKEPSYNRRPKPHKSYSIYEPKDEPHHVMIGGKKWKTFDTKSHAENVAKKIKGASVEKAS